MLTDQMMVDAYTGLGGFRSGDYLVRHPRELDDKYKARKELATYRNYCRKVLGAYVGTLFSAPAKRTGDAPAWVALQANADGVGGPIESVMRRALLLSMLVGTVYLVVDRPAGQARTRADELARAPYVVIRRPTDVAALALDRLGAVARVVFREQAGGAVYGAAMPTDVGFIYRGWDAAQWWVARDALGQDLCTDPETGALMRGQHGLGRVPVIRLHSTELMDLTAERAAPWAEPIVGACLDLFNRHSEARSIERDQTVSTLALPVSDPAEAERIREAGLTIGAANAVMYNPAGGGSPAYFAPPDGPLTLYYAAIAQTVVEIYEIANLEFTGGVAKSGVALAFHFQAANRTLGLFAAALETAERQVGALACAWDGQDAAELQSQYPRTFDVQDLAARLKEDLDALTGGMGVTAERLVRQRMARRVLGDAASPGDYAQIDAELLAGADPYATRIVQEAGLPAATVVTP
ncbi:hypothetical protein [uncultured Thiodictyon sp.]|uniref:hypothetical protein n=1 Tax=uncultured Thiodictyon sp. TaxID=1846217 RepID=UPI0025D8B06C|nr:hypothetical protein [uncultured Thiodictyon sp.]